MQSGDGVMLWTRIRRAVAIQLAHLGLSLVWNVAGLALIARGLRAPGPTASLEMAPGHRPWCFPLRSSPRVGVFFNASPQVNPSTARTLCAEVGDDSAAHVLAGFEFVEDRAEIRE